ncbi:hypothetical protein CONCODRAFT_12567 [Conidiobolus coronatus NRRL 28638]|uniref:Uncharacterized protein n=1 Tax=Conidiobolus coronatus (strain ATCC 28846 / CBS 209.66 / NRRL 28638) TaxID=796925 RepID=A0A137NSL0_CONC2|nr:hypothetical protein CONCODRAFT_12567 [Conidiobolus coronatus NRRL 28638]|eukprot:KXN65748.1 hypothetical protein CONCODRAFT_12567 [Conidiobolus coronatus NRRL 28638]
MLLELGVSGCHQIKSLLEESVTKFTEELARKYQPKESPDHPSILSGLDFNLGQVGDHIASNSEETLGNNNARMIPPPSPNVLSYMPPDHMNNFWDDPSLANLGPINGASYQTVYTGLDNGQYGNSFKNGYTSYIPSSKCYSQTRTHTIQQPKP